MAIAGASRTMFVAACAVPLAVDGVAVAAGWSGVPRSFVVIIGLYVVVLAISQTAQQHAVEQALANGDHAHRLLDELRDANANLSYEASHDMLTGIANRRRVLAVLADELTRVSRGSELAVLFLDLDGFKEINDTYGHATGDRLLVAAAGRIVELVGDGDHVGRQGGDEFIVLVRSRRGSEVLDLAERIRVALETSFRIGEHLVAVSASIGVVVCDRPGIAPDDVLRDADLALYRAKDLGRNCVAEHRGTAPSRSTSGLVPWVSCAQPSRTTRSAPTTSRSSTSTAAPSSVPRRSCGGSSPTAPCCCRASSCARSSRRGSTPTSGSTWPCS
jgi:diguanylate cyclase (GGDEF)-like protein